MNRYRRFFSIALLVLMVALAACLPVSPGAVTALTPSPTECDCTVEGTTFPTPTGGLNLGGPIGPVARPSATPTPNLADLAGRWPVYRSEGAGQQPDFAFAYPAVYDSPSYRFCAARVVENDPQGAPFLLALGSRTELRVYPAAGESLEAVAAEFQSEPARQEVRFETPQARTVGPAALPALTLPYRSGGTNRYGETTFFQKGDRLYRVDSGSPSACDVPEINLRELDAYAQLLETFE